MRKRKKSHNPLPTSNMRIRTNSGAFSAKGSTRVDVRKMLQTLDRSKKSSPIASHFQRSRFTTTQTQEEHYRALYQVRNRELKQAWKGPDSSSRRNISPKSSNSPPSQRVQNSRNQNFSQCKSEDEIADPESEFYEFLRQGGQDVQQYQGEDYQFKLSKCMTNLASHDALMRQNKF